MCSWTIAEEYPKPTASRKALTTSVAGSGRARRVNRSGVGSDTTTPHGVTSAWGGINRSASTQAGFTTETQRTRSGHRKNVGRTKPFLPYFLILCLVCSVSSVSPW